MSDGANTGVRTKSLFGPDSTKLSERVNEFCEEIEATGASIRSVQFESVAYPHKPEETAEPQTKIDYMAWVVYDWTDRRG